MEDQQPSGDVNKIIEIMQDHFSEVAETPEQVNAMINGVAEMVKKPGNKLVHFGNVLFLVSVFQKNMIEFHAMVGGKLDLKGKIKELAKEMPDFLKFLKKIEVKTAYTYMDKKSEPDFVGILKKYKFARKEMTAPGGKRVVAFYIEV